MIFGMRTPSSSFVISAALRQRCGVFVKNVVPRELKRIACYFMFAVSLLALLGVPLLFVAGLVIVCPILLLAVVGSVYATAEAAGAAAAVEERSWFGLVGTALAAASVVVSALDFVVAILLVTSSARLKLQLFPLGPPPAPALPAAGVCLTPRLAPVPVFALGC